MNIRILRASKNDIPLIHEMQVQACMPLLRKYKDYDSSPACETRKRIFEKFSEPNTTYFLILCDNKRVGAVRVIKTDEASCWIAPVFIIPQYQKKGIAQKVFALLEQAYPNVMLWKLDTILQEKGNCHLYEKLGYRQTRKIHHRNDAMDIVYYETVR